MQERKDKWSVGEWMTSNPEMVPPTMPVRDAFFQMRIEGYRHLLVVEDKQLLGIVTDRDLRRPDVTKDSDGWDDFYRLDENYQVSDIMTIDPKTLTSHDKLEKALDLFVGEKFGAIPIVNKNKEVIGILTRSDALSAFQSALKFSGDALRQH